jgi:class 3 adenylate cyclase
MEPQIRFCRSADGTRVAYVVLGEGPGIPVVSVNSWVWTIDMIMAQPPQRAHLEDLTDMRRVVTFDRRGAGASQRDAHDLSFESHVADLEAVVDRLDSPRVYLVGYGDGSAITAAYAARNPAQVAGLVLYFASLRGSNPDSSVRLIRENWSWARRVFSSITFPEGPADLQRWFSTAVREAMSPEVAAKAVETVGTFDVSDLLPRVQAPTLVVNYRKVSTGREVAALIPNARYLTLSGGPAAMWTSDEWTRAAKEFLEELDPSGESQPPSLPSGTAVILFADIADSTALTERLGDDAFRAKARELAASLRALIRECAGTPVEGPTLGDGVLAVFTSAREAIEAARRCGRAGDDAGLPLHLGLHAGDVTREKDPDGRDNVYGGAVNIASRISGLSAPGEVLVSETVRSLARTSAGVEFEDRGEQALKGVGEAVRVWAVVADAPSRSS